MWNQFRKNSVELKENSWSIYGSALERSPYASFGNLARIAVGEDIKGFGLAFYISLINKLCIHWPGANRGNADISSLELVPKSAAE